MKKLIVCLTVAAFAAITSLQAGEPSTKTKAECTAAKAECSAQVKSACCASQTAAKSACSAGKVARKNAQVKGATLLVRR